MIANFCNQNSFSGFGLWNFQSAKKPVGIIFTKPSYFGNLISAPFGCGGPKGVAASPNKAICLFLRGTMGQVVVAGGIVFVIYALVKKSKKQPLFG